MARGLTFDTGVLVALERRDRRARAIWDAALADGVRVTVPSAVVLEWWRNQRGPAARIVDRVSVEPLSLALARIAGGALAACGRGPSIVDAVVVASAAQRGDLVYTSDVDDLERVRDVAFPAVRILGV